MPIFSTFLLSSHCCGLLTRLELNFSANVMMKVVPFSSCSNLTSLFRAYWWKFFQHVPKLFKYDFIGFQFAYLTEWGVKSYAQQSPPPITSRAISKKWMHTFGSSLIEDFSICGEYSSILWFNEEMEIIQIGLIILFSMASMEILLIWFWVGGNFSFHFQPCSHIIEVT